MPKLRIQPNENFLKETTRELQELQEKMEEMEMLRAFHATWLRLHTTDRADTAKMQDIAQRLINMSKDIRELK